MRELAVLLTEGNPSRQDCCVAKVLRFFGVPSRNLAMAEFPSAPIVFEATSDRSRVLCSAETFWRLIEDLERNPESMRAWAQRVHSAFVYAGDNPEVLQKLARVLAGGDGKVVHKLNLNPSVTELVVSDHLNDFCGVMAGARVTASSPNVGADLVWDTSKGNAINIISAGSGATFLKTDYQQVPVFLSTARNIIDVDAEVASQSFDVREHFLSAVPVVLYIKWAFAETCWNASETNACLIIDDPLLKSAYGFVNYHELLSLMKRHRFSTNIAFIPWNWRRSAPEVVRLFRENPENYSISVHGCDHTRAEFGSPDREHIYSKAQQALARMTRHESSTGIRHDRVMVFPQGVFSEAAMSALKHTDLIAAVNNDVFSADQRPRTITVSEVWDIAVMGYNNFPIFTRRDPSEGIENFAFDILLGKPCVAVIHHDFCRNRYKHLLDFIHRLNALHCPLTWRSLGEVVRRSYRQREISPSVLEVEMYGTELRLENRYEHSKRFLIRRRECEPSAIKEIGDGSASIAWNSVNDRIDFEIELNPGENRMIHVRFHELNGNVRRKENVSYKAKTMLRRYLCEVRDNYVTPTKFRFGAFAGSR